jgi:hypothetical protein
VTAADMLSLKVHLAEMQARAISAAGEARIARARLYPWFFAFTAFVGLNLFQSAFTN